MVMIRTSSSRLKAKLGIYMRAVRDGKEVIVTDRDRPVAKLVPYAIPQAGQLISPSKPRDPAAPALGELEVHGIEGRNTDTTALLREDRNRR